MKAGVDIQSAGCDLPSRSLDACEVDVTVLEIEDSTRLRDICGRYDGNLAEVERNCGVTIARHGSRLAIHGSQSNRESAARALEMLAVSADPSAGTGDIDSALSMAVDPDDRESTDGAPRFRTVQRRIAARTRTQSRFMRALTESDLVFGIGPAGTGKTYLAVAAAVDAFLDGRVERIVLSRPAVEAGERLGFLPGDIREKIDPYLMPLYDALHCMLGRPRVKRHITQGRIEIAPLAFMRGRTLSDAFVVLDEAQNCTVQQMKMFLTRLGGNARMAVTGDLTQIDLPRGAESGLRHAQRILDGVPGVSVVRFSSADIVRHALVERIVAAYSRAERPDAAGAGI